MQQRPSDRPLGEMPRLVSKVPEKQGTSGAAALSVSGSFLCMGRHPKARLGRSSGSGSEARLPLETGQSTRWAGKHRKDSEPVTRTRSSEPTRASPVCCRSSRAFPSLPELGSPCLPCSDGPPSPAQGKSWGSPRPRVGAGGVSAGFHPAWSPQFQG